MSYLKFSVLKKGGGVHIFKTSKFYTGMISLEIVMERKIYNSITLFVSKIFNLIGSNYCTKACFPTLMPLSLCDEKRIWVVLYINVL